MSGRTLEWHGPLAAWQRLQDQLAAALGIPLRMVDESRLLLTTPSWPDTLDADRVIRELHVGEELEGLLPAGGTPPHAVTCQTMWGATYAAIPWGLRLSGPRAFIVLGPLLVGPASHPALRALKTMSHAGLSSLAVLLEALGRAQPASWDDTLHALTPAAVAPPRAIAQSILEAALAAVPADGGSVMLYEAQSESFEIQAAEGLREPWAIAAARRRLGEGMVGLAALERTVLLVDDHNDDPRVRERMARPDVVSSIVAPVSAGPDQPVLGVLSLRSQNPLRRFTKDHVAIIRKLVPLAAHALAASA